MARAFNGSSQYLHQASNITGSEFTVAGWMYWDSVSGTKMQFCQWQETNYFKHWYILSIGTTLYFGHSEDGLIGINTTHGTTLTASTWHHICARFKNSTSKSVALNGSITTGSVPGNIYSSNTPGVTIGADAGSPYSLYFGGRAAFLGIWNVSISDDELASLYSGRRHPRMVRPGSLVACWDLGGFGGENDLDRVGGYDMTATGSPTFADGPPIYYPSGPRIVVPGGGAPAAAESSGGLLLLGVGA